MIKISVDEYAAKLTRPFLMASLATVDHYLISAYSCFGAMAWHRHLDEDELFLGYSGTASIETSWGSAQLSVGELVTVPKGLPHRSTSGVPAVLLLVQTRGLASRRNGHQPCQGLAKGQLRKVSVAQEAARLTDVFQPRRIAVSDSLGVSVQICLGSQEWHAHEGDQLVLCHYGQMTVEGVGQTERITRGELVVLRAGEHHRVVSPEPSTAVTMAQMRD
ncbi:MAG: cupin domain-containing protein [Anaerolineae bacterium]|nr:cupin domain-containing protein [Anaerolineae bacterium]